MRNRLTKNFNISNISKFEVENELLKF